MARLQRSSVQFDIAMRQTLELTQAAIAETARREHAKVMNTDPRPGSFRRYVDGREGAPEEAVKADGMILYEYQRLDSVVQLAMETLFDLSPVLSGAYRSAHTLFVEGVAVPNLESWKPGSEIFIANAMPYTRKIELGKMTMRVPGSDHVYEQAERIVNRRMANLARTTFTYRTVRLPGAAVGRIVRTRKGVRVSTGGRLRTVDAAQRFPALVISER